MTHKQAIKELRKLTNEPLKIETHLIDPPITNTNDTDFFETWIRLRYNEWHGKGHTVEEAVHTMSMFILEEQQKALCPPTPTTE